MSGILLITKRIERSPAGGRELLCKLNRDCLSDLFGKNFHILELDSKPPKRAAEILDAFRGHIDGINNIAIASAITTIQSKSIGDVFLDGSNLGELAAALKRFRPSLRITTFFHNVEFRFFLGSLKASRTLRAFVVLLVNYLAEKKSAAFSDIVITLTRHDSDLLRQIYGRSATHVSPLALEDRSSETPDTAEKPAPPVGEKYLLFVGGAFYANKSGISWFIDNVVPRIDRKTVVVGKGMENLLVNPAAIDKVLVIGRVTSLGRWYTDAQAVIAPIFDGSGMKTKVAEGLMYGKKIIGTPEAFLGYEEVADRVGAVCKTAEEFIGAIIDLKRENPPNFNPQSRALYEKSYSLEAARSRMRAILMPDVL